VRQRTRLASYEAAANRATLLPALQPCIEAAAAHAPHNIWRLPQPVMIYIDKAQRHALLPTCNHTNKRRGSTAGQVQLVPRICQFLPTPSPASQMGARQPVQAEQGPYRQSPTPAPSRCRAV
jgi:hypothetical protein